MNFVSRCRYCGWIVPDSKLTAHIQKYHPEGK